MAEKWVRLPQRMLLSNLMELITQAGYEKLQAEINSLNVEIGKYLVQREEAKSLGDLRENSEYINLGIMIHFLVSNRDKLLNLLKGSQVQAGTSSSVAEFGSRVHLEASGGKKITYHIVSDYECSIEDNQVSINSELGQVLLGKGVSDVLNFNGKVWKVMDLT